MFSATARPKSRIRIRAEITKGGRAADVFLPDSLVNKLRRYRDWRLAHHEPLDPSAALFRNQGRRRVSKGRVQIAFQARQVAPGSTGIVRFMRCGIGRSSGLC